MHREGQRSKIKVMLGFINVGASDGLFGENSNELVALAQVFIDCVGIPTEPPGDVLNLDTSVL